MGNEIQINISNQIESIHTYFHDYANRQVNYAYTLRNWLIGMYLFEVEQKGKERAEYGEHLYKNIATDLKNKNIKGMSFTNLHLFKKFFLTYPSIVQLLSEQFLSSENQSIMTVQSLTEQFKLIRLFIKQPGIKFNIVLCQNKSDVELESPMPIIYKQIVACNC